VHLLRYVLFIVYNTTKGSKPEVFDGDAY